MWRPARAGELKGGVSRPPFSRSIEAVLLVALALSGASASAADVEAGHRKSAPCAACHGPDGNATVPGTPTIAGQPAFFTHWQLIKYRDGRRQDPQMSPAAQTLTDADMADLAAFYAAQPPRARGSTVDPVRVAAGRPLGLLPDGPPYLETDLVIARGDQLILYSDGVTEAQDEAGEEFGEERLQAVVHEAGGLSADLLADRILAAIDAFAGAAPQFDDITLMVVRRR